MLTEAQLKSIIESRYSHAERLERLYEMNLKKPLCASLSGR